MDIDLQKRVEVLETYILKLQVELDALKVHYRKPTELEEEIQEDVHCIIQFLRRITCGKWA